jgi:hypothetical protein
LIIDPLEESIAAWKLLRTHATWMFDDWEEWMTPDKIKKDDGIKVIHLFQKRWVECMTGAEPCRFMMFVYYFKEIGEDALADMDKNEESLDLKMMQKLLRVSWDTLVFVTPAFTPPDKMFENPLGDAIGGGEAEGQCCSFHVDVGQRSFGQSTIDFSYHSFFLYILWSTEVGEAYPDDAPDLDSHPVAERAKINHAWRKSLSVAEITECKRWLRVAENWACVHGTQDREVDKFRTMHRLWCQFRDLTSCRQYVNWIGKTGFWSCGMWSCDIWSDDKVSVDVKSTDLLSNDLWSFDFGSDDNVSVDDKSTDMLSNDQWSFDFGSDDNVSVDVKSTDMLSNDLWSCDFGSDDNVSVDGKSTDILSNDHDVS